MFYFYIHVVGAHLVLKKKKKKKKKKLLFMRDHETILPYLLHQLNTLMQVVFILIQLCTLQTQLHLNKAKHRVKRSTNSTCQIQWPQPLNLASVPMSHQHQRLVCIGHVQLPMANALLDHFGRIQPIWLASTCMCLVDVI
jgi:hypothetical protein